jgi:hypothetical protein
MAALIYGLCAITSITCFRLLFWSALCFGALSVNNLLLVADRVVFPVEIDLGLPRLVAALVAVLLLLFGLIWEED